MYFCLYEARIILDYVATIESVSLEPPTLEDTTHVKVGGRRTDIFGTKLQGRIVDVLAACHHECHPLFYSLEN